MRGTSTLQHSILRCTHTQGLDGVEPGGFDGGEDAGEDADQHAEGEGDGQRGDFDDRRVVGGGEGADQVDQGEGGRQPGQAAEDGDDDGLDQDLGEDVAGGRADGLADADFAHALGDAGEHDVHDADAAHQQADAGNEAAAQAGVVDEGVDLVGPVLLRPKAEVLDALVGAHENVADLLQGLGQLVHAGDLHVRPESRGSPVVPVMVRLPPPEEMAIWLAPERNFIQTVLSGR